MASIRLTIRKDAPDNLGKYPICIVYQIGKHEAVFSTGKKTNLLSFDKNNFYAPISTACPGHQEGNLHIRNLYNKLNTIVDSYFMANSAYPSTSEVKILWNNKSIEKAGLLAYFEQFSSQYKNNIGTYQNYANLKAKLMDYSNEISLSSLPDDLYILFADHLKTKHKLMPSTIRQNIALLKSYINWCCIKNLCTKKPRSPKLTTQNKSWHVFLTINELRELGLLKTDFEETKDAFILQSCLGVRYSDLIKVIRERLIKHNDNYYFTTKSKKTGKLLQVPLIPSAIEIISKRNGTNWIPDIAKMNKELKLIFKCMPDFNEKIMISRGDSDELIYKYELVTTHTARRTFINIMRQLKVDDATISAITGQSLMTLRGYYHPSENDALNAMERLGSILKQHQL